MRNFLCASSNSCNGILQIQSWLLYGRRVILKVKVEEVNTSGAIANGEPTPRVKDPLSASCLILAKPKSAIFGLQ